MTGSRLTDFKGDDMRDVAKMHQKAIARTTLKMTPTAASIMGGMDYPEAYRVVFGVDLRERLEGLVAEYGDGAFKQFEDGGVCWELGEMWTPGELLAAL